MPLDLLRDLPAGCRTDTAGAGDDPEGRLAYRLAEIERALDGAPARVRESRIRRAVWRALLLPADFVLWMYRRQLEAGRLAGKPNEDPDALQAMAYALVARAILGDVRATALLFDLVEGRISRAERRQGNASSSGYVRGKRSTAPDLDPVERAHIVAELEAALRKAWSG